MDPIWGVLMIAAGLFMSVCGATRSNFIVCRLMFYRSKMLWGEGAHRFLQITGTVVIILGILVALGYL